MYGYERMLCQLTKQKFEIRENNFNGFTLFVRKDRILSSAYQEVLIKKGEYKEVFSGSLSECQTAIELIKSGVKLNVGTSSK